MEVDYLYLNCLYPLDEETPVAETLPHLHQNYPNPFNPSTSITYYLPSREAVTLEIFDASGRFVTRLVDAVEEEGPHKVAWNGLDSRNQQAASGLYFYRLSSMGRTVSRKMVLTR